jgi:transmembrane sensor
VSSGAHDRELTLTDGEAAFAVAHDASRPFTVVVGDRQVRDLGTEFDVKRGRDELAVTVLQGVVSVRPLGDAPGATTTLGAGRQLRHAWGAQTSSVALVSAEDAFAWKTGRLIYRDQPLAAVVEDLNRYFPEPLRLQDGRAGAIRFTGVLTVDAEPATIRRLTALLPVSATTSNGAIVLAARENAR